MEKLDLSGVRQILERENKRPRKHASHFDWSDKSIKEKGTVESFLDPKNHKGQRLYSRFEMESQDPPDAWVFDPNNARIALEIMELVNEDAIRTQIKHDRIGGLATARDYATESERWGDQAYFTDRVHRCVQEKDQKCDKLFANGQIVELLLHSDEPQLIENLEKNTSSGFRVEGSRFRRIWLLLSYDPRTKSYPVVGLVQAASHSKAD
jgi:hypothetical protein